MNDQPPVSPQPTNLLPASAPRSGKLTLVFIIVLGLGALGFGLLAITGFSQAHRATATLEAAKQTAAEAARTDQTAKDAVAAQQTSESPFRAYNAPEEFGSFQINFPKTWSSSVDEERGSSNQVVLVLHPDLLRRSNGTDDLAATKVTLSQRSASDTAKLYTSQKAIIKSDITVSGIKAVQLSGTFSDKRTTRIVLVPVRDKTIIFTNEDKAYGREFDEIVAQCKIIP